MQREATLRRWPRPPPRLMTPRTRRRAGWCRWRFAVDKDRLDVPHPEDQGWERLKGHVLGQARPEHEHAAEGVPHCPHSRLGQGYR